MTSHNIGIRLVGLRRITAAVACALAAACGADSSSAPQNDAAARAATVFTQLADSIVKSGGDSGMAGAYASLGDALRRGGRVSPVTISVDGVPASYVATAQVNENGSVCPACMIAQPLFALRSFIAWQASDPRRVVQVSSASNADPIRAYITPSFTSFTGASASLVFFDGKGGLFFGTSGSQQFAIATSDSVCAGAGPSTPIIMIYPALPQCTNARFTIDFNGTAEPSSFLASKNNATGSHTFAMASQAVAGVRLEASDSIFIPPPPIVTPPRAPLSSTLGVKVDSLATLTLTVTNDGSTSVPVLFMSGQHSDFSVYDGATGERVWNSSMGILFTQLVSTDTIPAKGQRVFTAYWVPTKKGTFTATGSLVSRSHQADAKVQFTVP